MFETRAEVQRPLATVVIGGLITSTALTLLVLPAIAAFAARLTRHRFARAKRPETITRASMVSPTSD